MKENLRYSSVMFPILPLNCMKRMCFCMYCIFIKISECFSLHEKQSLDQDQQKISMNVCPECVRRCVLNLFQVQTPEFLLGRVCFRYFWTLFRSVHSCHLNVQWSTACCPPLVNRSTHI